MKPGVLVVVGALDGRGGLQNRWRRLATELAEDRAVTFLTWTPALWPSTSTEGGYRVVRLPALCGWDRDHSRPLEVINTAVTLLGGLVAAIVLQRRWRVAVGAGLHPEAVVAGLAARLLGRRFIAETWLVGPRGNVARLVRARLSRPIVRLLSEASTVLTASEEGAEELASLGLDHDRIRREVPAVEMERFAPATIARRAVGRRAMGARRPHVLVYAGRFDLRQKRLDLLLEGWRRAEPKDWELVLVGQGADEGTVRHMASAAARVMVRPWTDDIATILAGADAFALPTRFESPGYALFEGMATGLPGLVSDIELYRQLRPDGVDLVAATPEAWTNALSRLAGAGAEELARQGWAARQWIEAHLAPSYLRQMEEILEG